MKIGPLTKKMSPSEPPTVLEVEGCNSWRFSAIANSKHVSDSSTTAEYYSQKNVKKSKNRRLLNKNSKIAIEDFNTFLIMGKNRPSDDWRRRNRPLFFVTIINILNHNLRHELQSR